jgi:hypothetical protein
MSNYDAGRFSSNHSTIELIAHTHPDANNPSKNHDTWLLQPKCILVGEYTANPKKNPTQVLVHIIQDNKSEKNPPTYRNGIEGLSPQLLRPFLNQPKIDP